MDPERSPVGAVRPETFDDMSDWSSAPTFGHPDPTLLLRVRPSAYAIVRDAAGQIALVQTPGGCYLPGGGSDRGETVDETVRREVGEEIGADVTVGAWWRIAIEHVPVAAEGASFEKRSTFRDAELVRHTGLTPEGDHTPIWTTPADAVARLSSASHRWAVGEWLADHVPEQARPRPRM